ncbi:MAG: hypothetical protein WAV18_07445 [Roseiarcus sp.]
MRLADFCPFGAFVLLFVAWRLSGPMTAALWIGVDLIFSLTIYLLLRSLFRRGENDG